MRAGFQALLTRVSKLWEAAGIDFTDRETRRTPLRANSALCLAAEWAPHGAPPFQLVSPSFCTLAQGSADQGQPLDSRQAADSEQLQPLAHLHAPVSSGCACQGWLQVSGAPEAAGQGLAGWRALSELENLSAAAVQACQSRPGDRQPGSQRLADCAGVGQGQGTQRCSWVERHRRSPAPHRRFQPSSSPPQPWA